MSFTPIGDPRQKITVASLRERKLRHEPITCLTAYDYPSARLIDEAAIDIVLVGDSLAMTILGYENTLSVTVDEMLHHTKATRRGVKQALLVADMSGRSHPQRGEIYQRSRRRSRKDRRRREASRIDSPDHRRRNSSDRAHRAHTAVSKRDGRIQSSGQESGSRRATDARRCRTRSRGCRVHLPRRYSPRSRSHDHRRSSSPHNWHWRWA